MFLCDVKHSSQECDQKEFLQEVGDNIRGMEEVSITIIIIIITIITTIITIIIIIIIITIITIITRRDLRD